MSSTINVIFWITAVLISVFWGVYGCKEVKEDIKVEEEDRKMYMTKRIGIFLSEFIGSLVGWSCFYIITKRLQLFSQTPSWDKFGAVDIFLTIGAVIGIAGYSYKIVELIEEWK